MNKEIDIIIPALNAGYTIDKTLMSIAIQNIVDKVCVIIVDDCSNKEHQELYHKYMDMFKDYFKLNYLRLKTNCGPGAARREGFNFGNSKFVTFIDADDVYATSTSLFTLYNEINKEEHNNINYITSIFQEEIRDNEGNFVSYLDHTNDSTWVFGKIYRREALEKYHIMFNNSTSNEDCGLNTLFILCNKPEDCGYINRLTYCWNYNPKSITKNNDYSYNGLKGFIYNHIWVVHEMEKRMEEYEELNTDQYKLQLIKQIINTLSLCYIYHQTLIRDSRPIEQIEQYISWVVDFYRDVYIRYRNYITRELFTTCYKAIREAQELQLHNWIETTSVLEFLNFIDNEMLNECNIKPVLDTNTGEVRGYIRIKDIPINPETQEFILEDVDESKFLNLNDLDLYLQKDKRYNMFN